MLQYAAYSVPYDRNYYDTSKAKAKAEAEAEAAAKAILLEAQLMTFL